MLNFLRSVCNFCIKICDSINIYDWNGKEQPHQDFEDGYIFVKTLLCLRSVGDWTYIHIRKTQYNRFTINCGTYFLYLGTLHTKYIILLGLCLVLANGFVSSIFCSVVLRWTILLSHKVIFHIFLVVKYVCLDVKPLKYLIWLIIISNVVKRILVRGWRQKVHSLVHCPVVLCQ